MPVPNLISELSTTAASNNPPGSESPASLDDYQRAHAAFIAQLRDGKAALAGSATQAFTTSLLKVGPEAVAPWDSVIRAVDIGSGSSIFHTSSGSMAIAKNLYTDDDAVSWKYRAVGPAQLIWLSGPGGETSVYNAPSAGGAGTVATITNRFNVSSTGVVTFGANSALHTGNVFHGRTGAGSRLPVGWSVSNVGSLYTITHNLGTLNYTAAPVQVQTGAEGIGSILSVTNRGVNDFTIQAWRHDGVDATTAIGFMVVLD
jgi:hypothetical protein